MKYIRESSPKWHTRVKRHISDFIIPAQLWYWQHGSNEVKSLQGPLTKIVTLYLNPVVCQPPLLHISLREIFCLCVVKIKIFLTSEADQQNYRGIKDDGVAQSSITLSDRVTYTKNISVSCYRSDIWLRFTVTLSAYSLLATLPIRLLCQHLSAVVLLVGIRNMIRTDMSLNYALETLKVLRLVKSDAYRWKN
ncbi:hypothetical protein PV325_004751 [Microctonus aethiopoides]|nr:hypothetical protein PV325_004751 [Microctonus aethiopoides]